MMVYSEKDIEDIKPQLDRAVYKFLGFNEPSLVTAAANCLAKGYDESKTKKTLSALLDDDKAGRLSKMIFDVARSLKSSRSSRKRWRDDDGDSENSKRSKVSVDSELGAPLSSKQIQEMMANAQKLIEERKKKLETIRAATLPTVFPCPKDESPFDRKPIKVLGLPPVRPLPVKQLISREDKVTKIAQLQANIKSRLSSGVLGGTVAGKQILGVIPGVGIVPASPVDDKDEEDKPKPLILDSQGRTIDMTGKEVQLTHVTPTLKANIRAKKREAFKTQFTAEQKQQQQSSQQQAMSEARYFDGRIINKAPVRNKRALRFNDPGKFQQLAERMRMKAQLEKLQGEIFQIAKKTGISSAAKMALIAPKTQQQEEHIPELEWWDSVITMADGYGPEDFDFPITVKPDTITHLVEHPIQMRPPTEPLKPVCVPVFLTKKERKKLRRQNRREAWKEEQEKIRLGLEPAPEPKLRISNLMRVLGNEAIQDPTKIEAHVRAQMAKRLKAHQDANASRKLTPQQKKEKKARKMRRQDVSNGVHVAVYRVTEFTNPSKKFKVEANAKQLHLTGIVILYKDCNVVVVEGAARQVNKFNKLMMQRIKWEEDLIKGTEDGSTNKCVLVWKGNVKQKSFGEMKFKVCPTEKIIRDFFKKSGVEQYWDHAYSGTVLDHNDDLF